MTRALFHTLTMMAVGLQVIGAVDGKYLRAQDTRPAAQAKDEQRPDVHRPGNGVVMPRPVREVKPQYTADAMRAKIQGSVLLECVVETNGTVRQVEVVRSLDSRYGLDEAAIEAAKQWRFEPGTKDGAPVRVLVTIELAFTLGDKPRDIAKFALPEAFSAAPQADSNSNAVWEEQMVQSAPFTVTFSHPQGWLVTLGQAGIPITMQHANGALSATLMPLLPTKATVEPGTRADLEQIAKVVGNGYNRRVAAVGQIKVADRLWMWFDLGIADTPASTLQSLPPAVATARGSNQQWIFSTTAEGQQIVLAFSIFAPRDAEKKDWEALRLSAGPTFSRIHERMAFKRTR